MSAERRLAAPPDRVWAALNDESVLRACIPGCESLERQSERRLLASVRARIGPVSTIFKGTLSLAEMDPPHRVVIAGDGQGGAAGFARGSADVSLASDGPDTILTYQVHATVGGKLAQIGARLIDAAAQELANDFFERFAAAVAPPPARVEAEAAPREADASESKRPGLSPAVWVPLLVALTLAGLFLAAAHH